MDADVTIPISESTQEHVCDDPVDKGASNVV